MILKLPKVEFSRIQEDIFKEKNIEVFLQRDDLIHPIISGNKWRKLRYNIEKATQLNKTTILTFGGAHSNHLHATAEACRLANLNSIGIVRGEDIQSNTLNECRKNNMKLHFINREEYRMHNSKEYLNHLHETFDYPYIIPQGGDNYYGTLGCMEIIKNTPIQADYIFVASGTGTTSSGILLQSKETQKVYSVPALKGGFMNDEIKNNLQNFLHNKEITEEYCERLVVLDNYHFGGFAKKSDEIIHFCQEFYTKHNIKLDPIYTSKMMFALYDQIKKNLIPENSKILAIHTGGLQGIKGYEERYKVNLY